MIPEIGNFALVLTLCIAVVQVVFPLAGAAQGRVRWMSVARPAAMAQFLFTAIAFGCLTYSFVIKDFSVAYVAQNSNTQLPLIYRISAVWGAHEGSLLLWSLILAAWTAAVAMFSRSVPLAMVARVLGVMGFISIGFLLFMLLTSNPFERLLPAPAEGLDLNPLLQDFGLAVHPPMLYLGYVGFSVAFAFAIAALLSGRLDTAWARWSRPWTNIAWVFLTIGIAIGSWWAYYELGWGGWWFWDPVENASFMPWLVGTALIHSLAVTEKRGMFKAWTVLLAVLAFSLSLLGMFLVRSGVLTSVHAFANDPKRGLFILGFLIIVVGGSLLLYAFRASKIRSHIQVSLVSRESALLLNNVLLVVAAASILLGTLYPLVLDALGIGKISVGPPYFNSVFVPLTLPLAMLAGVGALMHWKRDSLGRLSSWLVIFLIASLAIGILFPWLIFNQIKWSATIGLVVGVWAIMLALFGVYERYSKVKGIRSLVSAPLGFYGMTVAHIGIGIFVIGVTLTSSYSEEKNVRLAPGESFEMSNYKFQFDGVEPVAGPNYLAFRGRIKVSQNGQPEATLFPEKRRYPSFQNLMTEAGIDGGFSRDLYVSLGEPVGDDRSWTIRLYYKPFIRWIWGGALIMAFGGMLGACDRRYRAGLKQSQTDPVISGSVVA